MARYRSSNQVKLSPVGKNKSRNASSFKRRPPVRPPYHRVLIVCEGSKTEPNYFEEIRQEFRIPSTHVKVISGNGTAPLQVVDTALETFRKIPDYEQVFAVFDRDDHQTYHHAIMRAEANASKLKNREKQQVRFEAVASVPSFEVWFLFHFRAVTAWLHRDQVMQQLREHVPGYSKGQKDMYAKTRADIPKAKTQAVARRRENARLSGDAIYTDVDRLVDALHTLRPKPLVYKEYKGSVEYDYDAGSFHGRVVGLNEELTFKGQTLKALEENFQASLEDYFKSCADRDKEPEKPR